MPDVKQVIAIVSNPISTNPNDHGRVTIGYYVLQDGLLTMTDGEGAAVRGRAGEKITHKMRPGDDAGTIARRLTLQIHRMARGESGPAGFNRPLSYPNIGII
jgi:hypothetical protein